MYLPEDKKDSSPLGKENGPDSRKLDALIEKCCIPCTPFKTIELHIAFKVSAERMQ